VRKRRVFLVLIAGVVCVGVIAAILAHDSEPVYEGKKLSEWVLVFDTPPGVEGLERWVCNIQEAEEALRHCGTNTVPYLVAWLRYETPVWKVKVYGAANRILMHVKPAWCLHGNADMDARLARGATLALMSLSFDESAVGVLRQIFEKPRGKASAGRAEIVLVARGYSLGRITPVVADAFLDEWLVATTGPLGSYPAITEWMGSAEFRKAVYHVALVRSVYGGRWLPLRDSSQR